MILRATRVALALVCLVASVVAASAAVAHVKSDQGECTSSTAAGNMTGSVCSSITSRTFTYTASATGDGVLFSVGCGATVGTPSIISLTATGWTFTRIGTFGGTTATGGFIGAFRAYAPNTSAATITVSWTLTTGNCANFMNDLIDEFSGMDATNFVDASGFGQGTTGCALSVTPVANNDGLWFACNDSVTLVGTYTKGADDGVQDVAEWKILSGGAGVAQASAWTSSGNFQIFGAAIKPAGAAACTPTLSLLGVGRCG